MFIKEIQFLEQLGHLGEFIEFYNNALQLYSIEY